VAGTNFVILCKKNSVHDYKMTTHISDVKYENYLILYSGKSLM